MKCLVDSHVFLWTLMSPDKLSDHARAHLLSPENDILLSVVSFWEISLKRSLGKLHLEGITPDDLPMAAQEAGFRLLEIKPQVAATFYKLPKLIHKDPFDRMLVWQSISDDCTLISKDASLSSYKEFGLKLLW